MIRGIDHLVIACEHPDAAAAELEAALGVVSTGGGRHPGSGTWNRIAWLADGSYLELIGVTDPEAARQSPVGAAALRTLDDVGGGLATYALRVDDLGATAAGLQAAGSSYGPAIFGSRTRDDGEVVEWWTSVPEGPLGPTMPFLIEHAYSGVEWGPVALDERSRFVHPLALRCSWRGSTSPRWTRRRWQRTSTPSSSSTSGLSPTSRLPTSDRM